MELAPAGLAGFTRGLKQSAWQALQGRFPYCRAEGVQALEPRDVMRRPVSSNVTPA